jgi:hypothetical protein
MATAGSLPARPVALIAATLLLCGCATPRLYPDPAIRPVTPADVDLALRPRPVHLRVDAVGPGAADDVFGVAADLLRASGLVAEPTAPAGADQLSMTIREDVRAGTATATLARGTLVGLTFGLAEYLMPPAATSLIVRMTYTPAGHPPIQAEYRRRVYFTWMRQPPRDATAFDATDPATGREVLKIVAADAVRAFLQELERQERP